MSGETGFTKFPVGFWSDANGTYAANLLLGSTTQSRWDKAGTVTRGKLQTAENPPLDAPSRVAHVNDFGLACGWTRNDLGRLVPCTWDTSTFLSAIQASAIASPDPNFPNGEAFMVNRVGWVVGYFAAAQSLAGNQDAFVKDGPLALALPEPMGFSETRALCINGKSGTPTVYRIGGWKRSPGGHTRAMLWKRDAGFWVEEAFNDPDNVLSSRVTWVADVNDNGVLVGRIEPYTIGIASLEPLDQNEAGGLFVYAPGDKVRRVSLPGLGAAVPVRINGSREILVNRDDNGVDRAYIVVPPSTTDPRVTGSVFDLQAVMTYKDAFGKVDQAFEFRDGRRWSGYGFVGTVRTSAVAFADPLFTKPPLTVESPQFFGFIVQGGDVQSLQSLDGDTLRLSWSGAATTITVRAQGAGTTSSYQLPITLRKLTAGEYKVKVTFISVDEQSESGRGPYTLTSDFLTYRGTRVSNPDFWNAGGGQFQYRAKLEFTATMTSGTASVEIERVAFAREF